MLPPTPGVSVAASSGRAWYQDRFNQAILGFVGLLVLGIIAYGTVPAQWVGRVLPGSSVVDDGAVALKPGSARPTDDRVSVVDLEVFEPEGEILFTTVSIDDQVTICLLYTSDAADE